MPHFPISRYVGAPHTHCSYRTLHPFNLLTLECNTIDLYRSKYCYIWNYVIYMLILKHYK